MVLDKFHVLQRRARAVCQRHAIAILILAFVVKGKTFPHPPVHRMTAFAVMASMCPVGYLDGHDPLASRRRRPVVW